MIKIEKETLLKNSPDYEDYTKNIVYDNVDERKGCGCSCKSGGCCKKPLNK